MLVLTSPSARTCRTSCIFSDFNTLKTLWKKKQQIKILVTSKLKCKKSGHGVTLDFLQILFPT